MYAKARLTRFDNPNIQADMTTFDQAVDHLSQYVAEDGRISMHDICAFARLHTDLHDAQFDDLAKRLIEIGIDVYDADFAEEAHIVEEIEERERGSIRENTQIYMRDVGDYELLSRDEELACARTMHEAMSEVLAAIAPAKPVVDLARSLFESHRTKNQLPRLLSGFLDHVEELPEIDRVNGDTDKNERQPPFDEGVALRRIEQFEQSTDDYFDTAVDQRTPRLLIAVEESFRFFKFATNFYTDFLDSFKDLVKSTNEALSRVNSVCMTTGVDENYYQEHLLPRLTSQRLTEVIANLPQVTQDSLNAHVHIIERARNALRQIESSSQLNYMDLLARDELVEKALGKFRQAKNDLVAGNLRLVMRIAQTYSTHGALLLDLVQEGNLGLIRAAEKFDYTRGFKFVTYATWWIRQAVTQALNEFSRTVRLPTSLLQSIRTVSRARSRLTQQLGRDPKLGELAEDTGLTVKQVRDVVLYEHNAISIDEPTSDDDDTTLVDTLISESVPSPEQIAMEQGLRDAVELTLADLTTRETQILTLRYGIGRSSELSTAEIARELGISPNRVRQLTVKALRRLRQPRYTPLLEPYL